MKLKIFTVYDTKAEAYMQPFFAQSTGSAIRSFTDAVNTSDHQFNKYPEDFTLFEVGSFDDQNCKIELLETPHSLTKAVEVKRVQE